MIITATFHPTIGGAETYAFEIARSLVASGNAVAVVTDLPREVAARRQVVGDPPGVLVSRLSKYRDAFKDETKIPWEQMTFGLMPELADITSQFEPNAILSNSLDTALLAKIVQLERDIPWAAAFHEQSPENEPFGCSRMRLVYELLQPSLVLAGSEFYAARAHKWGRYDRVRLIYHGVDTEYFNPAVVGNNVRQHYGVHPNQLLIVCAGRLKERKGMLELIRAFGQIAQHKPDVRLLIAGSVNSASRSYADQLRSEAEVLGVTEKVVFDETVTYDQMPSLLAAADIVAQPSLAEGLGLSVIEAMSSGKAVVTTDIPGIREITIEEDVAIIVPAGDSKALADGLVSLIDNEYLRNLLGRRARALVEHKFSRSRMIQQTEAALLELLHRN
jgi:glycosyltransferase involved in cell wall biosynthesis